MAFSRMRLVLVFLLFYVPQQGLLLKCKGEHNQDVDWYVLYKLPKVAKSHNPLIREGVAYLYMDSSSYQKGWTLSKKDISTRDSIPAYTLAPFYDKEDEKKLLWLLYNDQPPNEPSVPYNGHAKGAVIANENEGFWLIHSVPGFPAEPDHGENSRRKKYETEDLKSNHSLPIGHYAYPSSGKVNGQSFLCISTNKDHLDAVGKQLMYNQIIVYKKNLPHDLSKKFTTLVDAANEKKIKKEPFNNLIQFYSTEGMQFTSFAKSGKWGKDLYDNFVAPQLKTDLYAETWLNGKGKLPSDCSKINVMNVQLVNLASADVEFKSSHDHSKWAVAVDGKNKENWVCVGDINRADTQFERGGGTVCFNLPEVWKNYKDSVKDVEPCPKKKGIVGRIRSWFSGWWKA